jgi:hypothetical protein
MHRVLPTLPGMERWQADIDNAARSGLPMGLSRIAA